MVNILIDNLYSKIEGYLPMEVLDGLSLTCSFAPKGAEFSPKCQAGHWDGTRKLFKRRYQSFLTGLLSTVIEVLNTYNIEYEIIDKRVAPQLGTIPVANTPRDYQDEAVNKALEFTRGIIKGGCGAGKTNIMEFIISKTNLPSLVITHTSSVFTQTIKRFERDFGIPIGKIGGGSWDYSKNITVGLTASLTKWQDKPELQNFLSKVQCLLIDECHHIATKSILSISDACPNAYYRIGLSASPWRDDNADLLIQAITGRQIIDLSASYLIQKGYLTKPRILFIHFKHKGQDWQLNYNELYTKEVVNNIERNNLIATIAMDHAGRGESVLISVSRINHGETLETLIKGICSEEDKEKVRFVDGEDHPDILSQTLLDLHSKKLLCVIATSVYKEGVDVPSLDILINCKAEDSSVSAFQTIGRALRKSEGKEVVVIYDIYDHGCRWLGKHSENRETIYRTEPEFTIDHIMGGLNGTDSNQH